MIKNILCIWFLGQLCVSGLKAQNTTTTDSLDITKRDDFVTASLVVGSPLPTQLSIFGHATTRMQCPEHGLDYTFTFESDPNVSAFVTGIMGKAFVRLVAVPTKQYIDEARKQGRELRQYRLNLTLSERKELWQRLDEEMMAGPKKHFNVIHTNCVSSAIGFIRSILQGERLEWGPTPFLFTQHDGEYARFATRNAPWVQFAIISIMGTAYDGHSPIEHKLTPEDIIPLLNEARFVNDFTGESRPVLADQGEVILPKGNVETPQQFSPTLTFALLLALTLLVTCAERLLRWHRLGTLYDLLLFAAQTLVFIVLTGMAFWSELFPGHWNWYFIPFAPIPLMLWGWQHSKGKKLHLWWAAYCALLAVFIAATPLAGALDLPHQLITASLLVRSLNKATF